MLVAPVSPSPVRHQYQSRRCCPSTHHGGWRRGVREPGSWFLARARRQTATVLMDLPLLRRVWDDEQRERRERRYALSFS